jgi:hypothetical protein
VACGEESGENRIGMDWINSLTSKKQHHGYCTGFPLFLGISSLLWFGLPDSAALFCPTSFEVDSKSGT